MQRSSCDISVILPVYNTEAYLRRCIESLIRQTLRNIEIICVNDASTDRSEAILHEYSLKDERIRLLDNQKNRGAYVSRNKGLEAAVGKYVFFMDSDDWLELNTLEVCFEEMERNQLDIVYFGIKTFYENEDLKSHTGLGYKRHKRYENIYSGMEMFLQFTENGDHRVNLYGMMFRDEFIENHQIRFDDHTNHMDDLFYFQTILLAKRVKCLSDELCYRRLRENSLMTVSPGLKNLKARLINCCKMSSFICQHNFPDWLYIPMYRFIASEYGAGKSLCEEFARDDDLQGDLTRLQFNNPVMDAIFQIAMGNVAMSQITSVNYYFFPYHLFSVGERIVLYGAGQVGCQFYRQAKNFGDVNVIKVIDANDSKRFPKDIPVEPVESLIGCEFDSILISVCDPEIAETIKHRLISMGIEKGRIKWDGTHYSQNGFWEIYLKLLRIGRRSLSC